MENSMKNVVAIILILFLASLLSGLESCASSEQVTGRPINPSTVQNITDGKTKSEEIITWFGAPASTSQLGDNTLYIYRYCVSKGSGIYTGYFGKTTTEEKCDELTVTFDKDGTVKAHNFVKRVD
jgi:outer membrane protein assembly factor BamE (lipoprotein component of BamABCDE complex)